MQPKTFVRLLLFVLTVATFASAREPKLINIFDGEGEDDIIEFRHTGNKMSNALPKNSIQKWVKVNGIVSIPYTFRDKNEYDSEDFAFISEAMRRIENNTCIRFKERENEEDYVEIQNNADGGCATNLGRIGGRGVLQLEKSIYSTCMDTRTIQHELLHVAGLLHEHMRYDRDEYVKVHYENIHEDNWPQFKKASPYEVTTYNVPYDYESLMHYGKTFFTKNGRITLETLDPSFQNVIGKAEDASASDYEKVCSIYDCEICMGRKVEPAEIPEVTPDPQPETATLPEGCQNTVDYCHEISPLNPSVCDSIPWFWEICCASCLGF